MAISSSAVARGFQLMKAVTGFDKIDRDNEHEYQAAADMAAAEITPLARKMMVENLAASGLNEKTGTLRKAVEQSEVVAIVKGKMISLKIKMPRDPQTHDGQGKSDFFRMAGALNYGGVWFPKNQMKMRDVIDPVTGNITGSRAGSPLGAAAKRTLKKYAATGKMSNLARKKIESAYVSKHSGQTVREGYSAGTVDWKKLSDHKSPVDTARFSSGARVVMGRKFFYLKPSQDMKLGGAFVRALGRIMGQDFTP